ncbi:MAG TPA: hypothetical protein VH024_17355 [Candidatus Angelobacter sp.]|jgi:hypothetical protein|nr:hypothetical protein [Candidatus Angelobacter sp.]
MAKSDHIGFRLESKELEALKRAAQADHRSVSSLARMVLVEWLRKNGMLEAERRQEGAG